MKRFFSRLNYSFGNEDWKTEQRALQTGPNHHILCITASGDRPLHLLLDDCKKITSVDASDAQNHLLHLKSAAIKSLCYEEYIRFLGAIPCEKRKQSFKRVLQALNQSSVKFWTKYHKKIHKGVIYQGDIERLTKLIASVTSFVRGPKVRRLFTMNDLEEQRSFVDKEWDTYLMRKAFDLALSKPLTKILAVDPGLYSNVDPSIKIGTYVYTRMLSSLYQGLAKKNMLISLIFRGYVGQEAFPPYLEHQGFEIIKERLDRLCIKTQNILAFLEEAAPNSFDRFSLSDIASYMDVNAFQEMIKNIYKSAKHGARFCIRQFSSNHQIPSGFENCFQREFELEKLLEKEDNCFVYRFMVGTIQKPLVS